MIYTPDSQTESTEFSPQIIAETSEWFVVNKPAGWLSIAGRVAKGERASPVLYEWLLRRDPSVQVVHRLDRETSGVILFARGAEAHRRASLWFQNRETKKIYCCLAGGIPSRPMLKIQSPIEGAPCTTQVEVKLGLGLGFLAQIRPLTGRRHQIRIHLASVGHPIFGDVRYGGASSIHLASGKDLVIPRVALHAASLELPTGEKFEAGLPTDFSSWLERLKADGAS